MKRLFNVFVIVIAIAVLTSALSISAFAAENEFTITDVNEKTAIIHLDDYRAFCVQKNVPLPQTGLVYTITNFDCPARLLNVAVAISQLNDGTVEFETASQYAVWQCYENGNMVTLSRMVCGTTVSNYVKQILDAADMINMEEWSVNVVFYACEGHQTLATFGVNYIAPAVIPEFEDDKPNVAPESIPEETIPEETVPEETIPEETIPEETIPEETVPEETIPEETIPEETVPEETIPEETIPEETIPEETVPEETVPEETVPEETTPDPVIPPQEVLGGEPTAPQTGDNANFILWFALMAIATAGVVFAIKAKRN